MTASIQTEIRPSTQARTSRLPICFVIGYLADANAGTEGHLLRLLRWLDRDRFDPRLVVLQRSDWTDSFEDPQIPMQVLDFQSFKNPSDWSCIRQLSQIFRQHGTQVAELHMIDAHFAGAIAARWAGVPNILSCRRDLGHQFTRRMVWMSRLVNPLITRFVANSAEVVRHIAQLEHLSPTQFDVVCNGVDVAAVDREAQTAIPAELDAALQGKRVVSIAANLYPVKNHSVFLQAASRISAQLPDMAYLIMGHGELLEPLQRQAAELGLGDQVHWLGSVPSTAPYLVRSDVACLTSKAEGFSNAIAEYMAARLPVVATQVGGAAELIVEGETGYLVDSDDVDTLTERLLHLLRMPEPQRQAIGAAARRRIEERFTMEIQMRAFESLYMQGQLPAKSSA